MMNQIEKPNDNIYQVIVRKPTRTWRSYNLDLHSEVLVVVESIKNGISDAPPGYNVTYDLGDIAHDVEEEGVDFS